MHKLFYPEILTVVQTSVMSKLGFMTDHGFYLAGGTALALFLGHRTSLDFDFYLPEKFDEKGLKDQIVSIGGVDIQVSDGTVHAVIDGVSLSGFYYPYPLIGDLIDFETLKLSNIVDIGAMKVIAIIQRARQRDFFDMYYLITKIGFSKIIEGVYSKYPWYEENNKIIFKAMVYFTEADNDDDLSRINIFDETVTWESVKEFLEIEVNRYLKA